LEADDRHDPAGIGLEVVEDEADELHGGSSR
jgi:hypothetical protein